MGPGEKRYLTEEEILEDEEYLDMIMEDIDFESADAYDDEESNIDEEARHEEEILLAKYGL